MLQPAPWGDVMQPSTNLGDEGGGTCYSLPLGVRWCSPPQTWGMRGGGVRWVCLGCHDAALHKPGGGRIRFLVQPLVAPAAAPASDHLKPPSMDPCLPSWVLLLLLCYCYATAPAHLKPLSMDPCLPSRVLHAVTATATCHATRNTQPGNPEFNIITHTFHKPRLNGQMHCGPSN